MDLDEYIKGGADNEHKQLREGYGLFQNLKQEKLKIFVWHLRRCVEV